MGETSLSQLIRNPVYSGRRKNAKGGTDLEVEPLVTIDTQEQAKATLAQRAKPGRSTVKRPKALLAKLVCGAPDCAAKRAAIQGVSEADLAELGPSPMSCIISGKGKGTADYYRCRGRGPNRKGCGNMVRLPDLDQLVVDAFEHWHDEPHRDSVYVPGDSNADAIERLRQEMTEALRDADATAIVSIAASYGEKIAELEAQPKRPAHWEHTETGVTVGQHFLSLDLDGRRDYLMTRDIRARRQDGRIIVTVDGATARMGGKSSLADEPAEPAA